MNFDVINNLIASLKYILALSIFLAVAVVLLIILGQALIIWYRNRRREEKSLKFVLLEVSLPRDNEIKIDAAEQMISALTSVRKGGKFSFLKLQDHLSFEVVGLPEDIRFYVSVPQHLKDMVEKQINGAYPGAEIKEVNEYNIFSENGKVAFTEFQFRSAAYFPIKVYKDLPVDPLASITSALAKMKQGEGAAIQVLLTPADQKWSKDGRRYLSKTKKTESDPEKASFKSDPKQMEELLFLLRI